MVDTFTAQQRAQLTAHAGVGKIKNALLLSSAEHPATTRARRGNFNGNRWIWRANPMRLWHVTLRKAAPKRGITCDQAVSGIIDAWGVYQGLFPWSRGVIGVNWRDVEDASYSPSFFSWLFNSYTVRVGHRFIKSSEIQLSHIANGSRAVVEINDSHRRAMVQ